MPEIICSQCHAENGAADVFCYKCGERLVPQSERGSNIPFWCGMILIFEGVLSIISITAVEASGHSFSPYLMANIGRIAQIPNMVAILISLVPIAGGVFTIRGYRIAGGIGALVGYSLIGPFGLCIILSTIVAVVIAMNKKEFGRDVLGDEK